MNYILYILSFFFVLVSCGQKDNAGATTEATEIATDLVTLSDVQLQSAKVEIGKARAKKSMSTVLKVNGAVDVPPQSMVSISAPLGGYLKSTKLLPGMYLKKGEVIATMEDQQYIQLQEDYLVTKSNLAYAEAEFLRQQELNLSKSSSDKIFQQARMEYDNQKIRLRALAEKLQLINIRPQQLNEQNISREHPGALPDQWVCVDDKCQHREIRQSIGCAL
jgi:cobalt-zinc-cadmium efflux system membrane fusion protein